MRLLLDTHVVLWQLQGSRIVGPRAREAIERADELAFSVVSFAEIGVKAAIGKLVIPQDLRDHVVRGGMRILGLAAEHGLAVARLPMHHRDPFDRLLIAQARSEGLTLLSADARFAAYDVALIDASG
ncbi:MAG: type II toxin-antitoxin system VapC family toxin [Solirubrobacteraceae bacterium]|nr:type II toxin-antitoxin system VapC family toxin [Solirubrobacteraceae bacterium]